jgi:hypothetical protein
MYIKHYPADVQQTSTIEHSSPHAVVERETIKGQLPAENFLYVGLLLTSLRHLFKINQQTDTVRLWNFGFD